MEIPRARLLPLSLLRLHSGLRCRTRGKSKLGKAKHLGGKRSIEAVCTARKWRAQATATLDRIAMVQSRKPCA
jgi:hypothetical protein